MINLLFNIILLFPFFDSLKKWFLAFYTKSLFMKGLSYMLNILYVMIIILFLDSMYKNSITDSKILEYQTQRNMYLSGFALFLVFNFRQLSKILNMVFVEKKDHKYILKQHKNAGEFLETIGKQLEIEKQKNNKLETELKNLKDKLTNHANQIAEMKNIKINYLKLQDKYEKLMEKVMKETKKNK